MYQITSLFHAVLAASQRIAADTNTAGVDLSAIQGNALFQLNASAPEGAAQTADFKLQHSDTQGGTYTDAGIAFAQVTTAGGASFQSVMANTDGLKKFVRVFADLGGTSPAITFGVIVTGKKHA